MSLVTQANQIINTRSEEKERQYGPLITGMEAATAIANCIQDEVDYHSNEKDKELESFRYLYGLKLSRQKYNHKEDNLLDAIAYRIGEINAILINIGGKQASTEDFAEMYDTVSDWTVDDPIGNCYTINQLTKLNTTGDDIFKIHLALEMGNEAKAIRENETQLRILSILKQIRIMDQMNDYNNDLT